MFINQSKQKKTEQWVILRHTVLLFKGLKKVFVCIPLLTTLSQLLMFSAYSICTVTTMCEVRFPLVWDFSRWSHTSDLKTGTPMATLASAWHSRVNAGTGWSSVSILWLNEVESLICNLYLSMAACKLSEQIHPWDRLACCWDVKRGFACWWDAKHGFACCWDAKHGFACCWDVMHGSACCWGAKRCFACCWDA